MTSHQTCYRFDLLSGSLLLTDPALFYPPCSHAQCEPPARDIASTAHPLGNYIGADLEDSEESDDSAAAPGWDAADGGDGGDDDAMDVDEDEGAFAYSHDITMIHVDHCQR